MIPPHHHRLQMTRAEPFLPTARRTSAGRRPCIWIEVCRVTLYRCRGRKARLYLLRGKASLRPRITHGLQTRLHFEICVSARAHDRARRDPKWASRRAGSPGRTLAVGSHPVMSWPGSMMAATGSSASIRTMSPGRDGVIHATTWVTRSRTGPFDDLTPRQSIPNRIPLRTIEGRRPLD